MTETRRPDEPAYAGIQTYRKTPLVLEAADLEDADVAVLGAPVDDLVTHRSGARFAPRAIRQASDEGGEPRGWHMDLGVSPFGDLKVVDHGDAEVMPMQPLANLEAIERRVAGIVAAGAIPVILGGDHSISFATIRGALAHHPKDTFGVVQFDTHADTATTNWDHERGHGTPFRHLVDQGHVRGDRLVQVGLRGLWPYPKEFAWARDAGVRWHRMEEVTERGIDQVVTRVVDELAGIDSLFLSVDIDVLDPAFAPGTGTPEPGGMTTVQLLRAVRELASSFELAGLDVVEVSPPYDHAGITAMAADRVVVEAIAATALRRSGRSPAPEEPDGST